MLSVLLLFVMPLIAEILILRLIAKFVCINKRVHFFLRFRTDLDVTTMFRSCFHPIGLYFMTLPENIMISKRSQGEILNHQAREAF